MKEKEIIFGVICVLTLAALLAVLAVSRSHDRARVAATTNILAQVAYAVECWQIDKDTYPTNLSVLQYDPAKWTAPYLPRESENLKDGWGRPVIYSHFNTSKVFGSVGSLGKDGKRGGQGVDADLEVRFPKKR